MITIITASLNPSSHPKGANIVNLLESTKSLVGVVEHLIVDGGSTDGTQDVVKRFPHATLIDAHGSALFEAFNIGIDMAVGEWLYFIGGDDRMAGDTVLAECVVLSNGADVVHAEIQYGKWPRSIPNPRIEAWLHKADLMRSLGKFNVKNTFYADRELHAEKDRRGIRVEKVNVLLAIMETGGHASRGGK